MDILERFYLAINREAEPHEGIHVSALSYDCLRRGYYSQKYGDGFFDLKTLLTFWIGRQIHKTPILKEHELPLEWNGIVGTCDEYEDGLLLEKKTCTAIPKWPNDHHVRQAEYYAVMLAKAGRPVRETQIVYIDVSNKDIKAFPVNLRPVEAIEKEMLAKKEILEKAIREGRSPERKVGWLCSYCNFSQKCFSGDGDASKTLP